MQAALGGTAGGETPAAAATAVGEAAGETTAAAVLAVREALNSVRERVRAAVRSYRRSSCSGSVCSNNSNDGGSSETSSSRNSSSNSSNSINTACTSDRFSSRECLLGVRVLAVSKRQPAAAVAAAAAAGQRHFGENYVQELIVKYKELQQMNLRWHMIGHLQSNKVKLLMKACPELYMVETLDSQKLAQVLNSAVAGVLSQRQYQPLKVLVQVNTAGEESKGGVTVSSISAPAATTATTTAALDTETREGNNRTLLLQQKVESLVTFIVKECIHLRFSGLMTIGPIEAAASREAFKLLAEIKQRLLTLPAVQALFSSNETHRTPAQLPIILRDEEGQEKNAAVDETEKHREEEIFELSMGMSGNLEEAIAAGSTEVRIGTAIFGARPPVARRCIP